MLTRQNRDRIVEALLSGKYTQARHMLVEKSYVMGDDEEVSLQFDVVGHCCIAVAYDVVAGEDLRKVWDVDTGVAAQVAGFTLRQRGLLVNLNDEKRRSFEFIAGVISTFPVRDELATFDERQTLEGIVEFVKDEDRYRVTCWRGNDAKWSKQFGTYDEARKEFESCRSI